MMTEELVMVGYYDYRLVALSVVISILASYAARNLSERLNAARGRAWLIWLVFGATVDGIGTWSMHYTGMLAFHLPVPVLYDWPTVLLSLLAGILGSAGALLVVGGSKKGWTRALAASILLGGVGISVLHYTAMAAMRLRGMHHYSPLLVTLSVVLAIGIVRALPNADLSSSGPRLGSQPAKPRKRTSKGGGQPCHALHRDGGHQLYVCRRATGPIPRRADLVPRCSWY